MWVGCKHRDGYARLTVSGKSQYGHRFIYENMIGKIPKNKILMHNCDNPSCVNPYHLKIGTPKENTHDMIRKKRNKFIGMSGKNHWNYRGKS